MLIKLLTLKIYALLWTIFIL